MDIEVPKLPKGMRYGAEMQHHLTKGESMFHAPAGHAITKIDKENGVIHYAPVEYFNEAAGIWVMVDSVD